MSLISWTASDIGFLYLSESMISNDSKKYQKSSPLMLSAVIIVVSSLRLFLILFPSTSEKMADMAIKSLSLTKAGILLFLSAIGFHERRFSRVFITDTLKYCSQECLAGSLTDKE